MIKRFLVSLLTIAFVFVVQPAFAATYDKQVSDQDTSDDYSGNGVFDLDSIEFALSTDHPDKYFFWLNTNGPVKKNTFNDNQGTWAAVFIDVDGDGETDYSLSTEPFTLKSNEMMEVPLWDSVAEEDLLDCKGFVWADIDSGANWLGFGLEKSCIEVDSSFWIQGYIDYDSSDQDNFDYAPESYFEVTPGLESEPVPDEDPELVAFEEAAAAVRAAELNNEKYDMAFDLVAELTDSDRKTLLEDRLEVVSDIIDARQVLEDAEEDFAGYDKAKEAIELLPEGSVKVSFTSRLIAVKKKLDAARLAAQRAIVNKKYANCAAMNKVLPGGIAKVAKFKNKGALLNYQPFVLASGYALNAGLDRDKDGIACER